MPGDFESDIRNNASKRIGSQINIPDRSKNYPPPDIVAVAVEEALFDPQPQRRYLVALNQQEAESTIRTQIEHRVQLNEDQSFSYDREMLVRILDQDFAKARQQYR